MSQAPKQLQNVSKLADRIVSGSSPGGAIVVTGAGLSHPYPIANTIKRGIIKSAINHAFPGISKEKAPVHFDLLEGARSVANRPYLTLETLFFLSEYVLDPLDKAGLRSSDYFDPKLIIRQVFSGLQTSPGNLALAWLRQNGMVGPIVTPNFDTLLVQTLNKLDFPTGLPRYRIKTEAEFDTFRENGVGQVDNLDIVAFHGTLVDAELAREHDAWPRSATGSRYTDPNTLVARGLMRLFRPDIAAYFEKLLSETKNRDLILVGYSGQDHYDFNLALRQSLARANKGQVDGLNVGNVHWVSYSGQKEDLSDYAWSLGCNYDSGDLAWEILRRASFNSVQLNNFKIFEKDSKFVAQEIAAPSNWFGTSDRRNPDVMRDRARELVELLRSGFAGAWAVSEYYSLESYGFEQSEIELLGGVSSDRSSSVIEFGGVDARDFLKAQEKYWIENKFARSKIKELKALEKNNETGVKAIATVDGILAEYFPNALPLLVYLKDRTDRLVEGGESRTEFGVADADAGLAAAARRVRSMLMVFHAMAWDYIGLAFNVIQTHPHLSVAEALRASELSESCFEKTIRWASHARQESGETLGDGVSLARELVVFW